MENTQQGEIAQNQTPEVKPAESTQNPYALAKSQETDFLNPVVWDQMKGMAAAFIASKALKSDENAGTLIMKIQAGYEMGMKPIEAIKSFYFVNGTLNIFGAAVMRRLREHGWRIKYEDEHNKCTAIVTRGDEEYTDSLTYEEAEKSGWASPNKAGWKDGVNRKLKLRYGVISMILKTYIPEVLGSAVDIAEVAEDTAPMYQEEAIQIEGAGEPATEAQIHTLRNLGYEFPKDADGNEIMPSKGDAATEIKNRTAKGKSNAKKN